MLAFAVCSCVSRLVLNTTKRSLQTHYGNKSFKASSNDYAALEASFDDLFTFVLTLFAVPLLLTTIERRIDLWHQRHDCQMHHRCENAIASTAPPTAAGGSSDWEPSTISVTNTTDALGKVETRQAAGQRQDAEISELHERVRRQDVEISRLLERALTQNAETQELLERMRRQDVAVERQDVEMTDPLGRLDARIHELRERVRLLEQKRDQS